MQPKRDEENEEIQHYIDRLVDAQDGDEDEGSRKPLADESPVPEGEGRAMGGCRPLLRRRV